MVRWVTCWYTRNGYLAQEKLACVCILSFSRCYLDVCHFFCQESPEGDRTRYWFHNIWCRYPPISMRAVRSKHEKSLRECTRLQTISDRSIINCNIRYSAHMGVSLNGGTPKSSILIGISIINHPFWGTPILGNPHIYSCMRSA